MQPIIDLAPGAEENPLASRLAELIRSNIGVKPYKARDFRALRGAVQIVALDVGQPLTLRFDHGRLTIHDGSVGIPTITISGDTRALLRLADLPFTRVLKLPLPVEPKARPILQWVISALTSGELKIYGLFAHPRLALRFLRILSVHG